MGKKAERNTLLHQSGVAIEQTSIYDDSLLPPSEELAKLKELDADCIDWIKRRTEIEQDARINFNENKIKLMQKDMNQVTAQNIICILVMFFIILSGMGLSALFIYKGLDVSGTIFGGSSIVMAVVVFSKFRSSQSK